MRISDWSSDVCSSDLLDLIPAAGVPATSDAAAPAFPRAAESAGEVLGRLTLPGLGITGARGCLSLRRARDVSSRMAVGLSARGSSLSLGSERDRKSTRLNSSH